MVSSNSSMNRLKNSFTLMDALIYLFMFFVIAITTYPFIYIISMSFSEFDYVLKGQVWLLPKGFTLDSYRLVFRSNDIWRAYYNTIIYVTAGSCITLIITMLAAYPLSRKQFFFRNIFMFLLAFTMFFGGGLIPMFILISNLGMYNTRWAIILPGVLSPWYIIITRTYLMTIPESLHESVKIDGGSDFTILMRIILPLSKPIIAIIILFSSVAYWNSYFSAMIYLPNNKLHPIQLFLVRLLFEDNTADLMNEVDDVIQRAMYAMKLKYASIIVVVFPILLVYPFLQKYFVQGVMIGSLKG